MEYIKSKDYDYIMNKYHNASQPFDGHSRFIRKDDIFSDDTGMDGDKIREEILRRDEEIKHLSHPVRKAKAYISEALAAGLDIGKGSGPMKHNFIINRGI